MINPSVVIELNNDELIEISDVYELAIKRVDYIFTFDERQRMGFEQPDEMILILSTKSKRRVFPKTHYYALRDIRKFTVQ